jgi:hypothetical protein
VERWTNPAGGSTLLGSYRDVRPADCVFGLNAISSAGVNPKPFVNARGEVAPKSRHPLAPT